jgi:hypothetical protein
MSVSLGWAGILAALLLAFGSAEPAPTTPRLAADKPPEKSAPLPACITVKTRAQYGALGYDHIVRIENGCTVTAACVVTTDVNPEPIAVRVASGKAEEVVTFRGSPSYRFVAKVRCVLER